MANNRMYLVCNVCKPNDKHSLDTDKGVLGLAKWYPGGRAEEGGAYFYYGNHMTKFAEDFFVFLEKHTHPEVASKNYLKGAGQENPVRIVYEVDGLPKL